MKYAYPAILYPDDGKIGVAVPDLPGCYTFGDNEADALFMARDAVEMWLWHSENTGTEIPPASSIAVIAAQCNEPDGYVSLIAADTDEYRRQHDARAVKKTLSIPAWLNHQAEQANAPFSQILQEGLKRYLNIQGQS